MPSVDCCGRDTKNVIFIGVGWDSQEGIQTSIINIKL